MIVATLDTMDKTFFKAIRKKFLDMGNTVPLETYIGVPNGRQLYDTALNANEHLFHITGVSNYQTKSEFAFNTIRLSRINMSATTLTSNNYIVDNEDGTFTDTKAGATTNILYHIRIYTQNANDQRIALNNILSLFDRVGGIQMYDPETNDFTGNLVTYTIITNNELSPLDTDDMVLGWLITVRFFNIHIGRGVIDGELVQGLNEFKLCVQDAEIASFPN